MASIHDYGGVPPDNLKSPPLGGPNGWAAAVAAVLGDDEPVDQRIAWEIAEASPFWQPWTPSIVGGTVSSTDCRYMRSSAGLVVINATLTIATVTGNFSLSLPTPAAKQANGTATLFDANGGTYGAQWSAPAGSTVAYVYALGNSSQFVLLSPTAPFTWAPTDRIAVTGLYQAA